MANIENSTGMQNVLNDLNLHPDVSTETEVYNGMEQQEMTNRMNERRYEEEDYYDDEPQTQNNYNQFQPINQNSYPENDYYDNQSSPEYYEEEREADSFIPDENNDGIPDNEEIGTYNEEDNYPDALEEELLRQKQQEEAFLLSEETKRELEAQEREERRKEMFNNVKAAGAGLVGAAAGFFAGKAGSSKSKQSKPKQSNPNYKAPKKVKVGTISNGTVGIKTQKHEFGVNPLGQGTFFSFPQAPKAPTPYGAQPRKTESISYNEEFDPIGFRRMGNGFEQHNPFGLEQRALPQNENAKKAKKWGKDTRSYGEIFGFEQYENNNDVFGFGSLNGGGVGGDVLGLGNIQSGDSIFGFSYEQPVKKSNQNKKSNKTQSQEEFESVFGFKFV